MLAVSRPGTTTEVIEPAEAALRGRSHFVLAGAGRTQLDSDERLALTALRGGRGGNQAAVICTGARTCP